MAASDAKNWLKLSKYSSLNNDLCHTSITPPSPTYNVGGVNESQSQLMLLMLKLQHSQIPNIVSGGEGGRLLVIAIKAYTLYTTDKTKSLEDADSCTK